MIRIGAIFSFILLATTVKTFAGSKKMTFCKSGIEITVTSKNKMWLFEWPEYRNAECGIKVYTNCTKQLSFKGRKFAIDFKFHPDSISGGVFMKIDSCFQTLTIDNSLVKLCRLRVYGHEMFIAQIYIANQIIDMTFGKREYDFAMQLLQDMRITQLSTVGGNTTTTASPK